LFVQFLSAYTFTDGSSKADQGYKGRGPTHYSGFAR